MAPERCNNSGSKKASLLAENVNNCKIKPPVENSPAMILKCHAAHDIPRRSATKLPEYGKSGKRISSLPSGKGHECPLSLRKRKAEKRDESLEEHGGALRTHAHVHAEFVLGTDVQWFRGEFDGRGNGINRDAEMEMRLRPDGGGTGHGIEDGEGYRNWDSYICRKK